MKTYYIYHIPTYKYKNGAIGKIGVSNNPKARVRALGYHDHFWEILEVYHNIDEVSDREKELQKLRGYRVDIVSYKQMVERQKLVDSKRNGQLARDSGQFAQARQLRWVS
jgi:hypothetical protein